ncbi:hypothetical protein Tco_0425460 [Tanacetum coccineum]
MRTDLIRSLNMRAKDVVKFSLWMAASSSTAPFSLDLYHNGYFKVKPLTYIDSEMVTYEDSNSTVYYVDQKNANLGDYIRDEFSDVASLDHLSEGEKSQGREGLNAYDESRLVLHNDSDDNDCEVDPLFSNLDDDSKKDKVHVEPESNSEEDMHHGCG